MRKVRLRAVQTPAIPDRAARMSTLDEICRRKVSELIQAALVAEVDKAFADSYFEVSASKAQALLNDHNARRPKLSEREKEVLVAWFQTGSKDLVGDRLFIAPSTVRTHLQRVRAKYAAVGRPAPTKSALLARAIEDGILSLADL